MIGHDRRAAGIRRRLTTFSCGTEEWLLFTFSSVPSTSNVVWGYLNPTFFQLRLLAFGFLAIYLWSWSILVYFG